MKNFLRAVTFVAATGFFFISNPGPEAFETYVEQRVAERINEDRTDQNRLGRMLTDMGSSVVGSLAARASERKNFLLFSIYTVDIGGDGDPDEAWKFLGIAGLFVEMSSPQSD